MTLREQIRRKLCELVFDDGEPKKKINKITDEILALVEKALPSSNRKSCILSDHYSSRYKQGWNDYRKRALDLMRSRLEVEQVIKGVK